MARPFYLELIETPAGWTGESPEKHGLRSIPFPTSVGGVGDVPTLKNLEMFIHQKFDTVSHPRRKACLSHARLWLTRV